MSPKELAAHYEAKVFDTSEAAEKAGFVITETMSPRNTWNKASAAQAIMHKLLQLKQKGEASEIGLVLEGYGVSGCYKKPE
ncbi:MAG: hypothetical protein DMF68_07055 [Acidobacteria bacterium]|nr:MAG: hypothetical protein DMF68_07055 [Acidobacteriota bacterium]